MKNLINVNVFLCEKYDEENKNIVNIFNKVKAGNNHRASFTIFVMIGSRSIEECSSGKFALHFYLTKKKNNGNKMRLYVGTISASFCDESTEDATYEVIKGLEMKEVPFIEEGKYTVEVYFSDEIVEGSFEEIKEKRKKIVKDDNLMTRYAFEVFF